MQARYLREWLIGIDNAATIHLENGRLVTDGHPPLSFYGETVPATDPVVEPDTPTNINPTGIVDPREAPAGHLAVVASLGNRCHSVDGTPCAFLRPPGQPSACPANSLGLWCATGNRHTGTHVVFLATEETEPTTVPQTLLTALRTAPNNTELAVAHQFNRCLSNCGVPCTFAPPSGQCPRDDQDRLRCLVAEVYQGIVFLRSTVDRHYAPPGYLAVPGQGPSVEQCHTMIGNTRIYCHFLTEGRCPERDGLMCAHTTRPDNRSVIFIKERP